ncbi:MAG: sulfatase-like hydrolase/transferase [Bacteroidales bacterium]|nr:sulfatase-like hydrolase/transferase [Bacteroidales bacterium]
MKNYYQQLLLFAKRLLLFLLLMEFSRLFFLILNFGYFGDIGFINSLSCFFFGLQFDIYVFFVFLAPFTLMSLLPGNFVNRKSYQLSLKIIFIVFTSLLVLANFVDSEYFRFNFKRSTADVFSFLNAGGGETENLLPVFLRDFWYILLVWIGLLFGAWKIYPKSKANSKLKQKFSIKFFAIQNIILVFVIALLFTISRGLQRTPLNILSASKYTEAKYIPLVLNTPFTLILTWGKSDLEKVEYFKNSEELKIYNPVIQFNKKEEFKKQNVVIIILESFSQEYSGILSGNKCYTPFLDSLAKKGLSFKNGYANGKRSIEALPAILAGIPTLMNNAYVSSAYSVNQINSLATVLKEEGYVSSFFHGGKNGTMAFDDFAKIAGFDEYYGYNEYPEKSHYDGNWGIFDEEYLQYFAGKLNEYEQPFLSVVFTLSSHHPYSVPEKYAGKFEEGPVKITKVIEYADYSLRKFFETASKMDWYNNTLFVLVADHTGQAIGKKYYSSAGTFRVPIIYFHPADSNLCGISEQTTQQIDIMPSILDYLNYTKPFLAFGNSVFTNAENPFAIMFVNNLYQLITNEKVYQFDGKNPVSLYFHNSDILLEDNKVENSDYAKEDNFLKAFVQIYNSRLIDNKMLP